MCKIIMSSIPTLLELLWYTYDAQVESKGANRHSVIVVGHVHQLLGRVVVWASWLAVTVFCSPPPMPIGFISAALTINLTLAEMSFSEQLSTQLPSSLVSCLSDAAPIHELKHRSASSLFTIPNCRRFCNMNSSSSLAASARLENAII